MNAVLATPVDNPCRIAVGLNDGMPAAYVSCLQLDVIVLGAPDRQAVLKQGEAQQLIVDRADQYPGHSIGRRTLLRHALIDVLDDVFYFTD